MPKNKPKGKNTFTQVEASEILALLAKLPTHKRENQKRVRDLRKKLSFYISDFTEGKGFDANAFNYLVSTGDIKII